MVASEEAGYFLVVVRVRLLNHLDITIQRRKVESLEFGIKIHSLDSIDGVQGCNRSARIHIEHIERSWTASCHKQAPMSFIESQCYRLCRRQKLETGEDAVCAPINNAHL